MIGELRRRVFFATFALALVPALAAEEALVLEFAPAAPLEGGELAARVSLPAGAADAAYALMGRLPGFLGFVESRVEPVAAGGYVLTLLFACEAAGTGEFPPVRVDWGGGSGYTAAARVVVLPSLAARPYARWVVGGGLRAGAASTVSIEFRGPAEAARGFASAPVPEGALIEALPYEPGSDRRRYALTPLAAGPIVLPALGSGDAALPALRLEAMPGPVGPAKGPGARIEELASKATPARPSASAPPIPPTPPPDRGPFLLVASIAAFLFAAAIAVVALTRRKRGIARRVTLCIALSVVFGVAAAAGALYSASLLSEEWHVAIGGLALLNAPFEGARTRAVLSEGEGVMVTERRGGWIFARSAGGFDGWIDASKGPAWR